ncbi:MAG: hypothetical protein HYT77_10385 [Deltaproteobacteria bacterium]|nr:hypothetical protein [Deltaproteobacteria bacterium]
MKLPAARRQGFLAEADKNRLKFRRRPSKIRRITIKMEQRSGYEMGFTEPM